MKLDLKINTSSMQYMIVEFSLIIMLCLFVFYTDETVSFSRTILGRMITVFLLVYITSVNLFYGILFCLLILFYYRTDYVEPLLNMEDTNTEEISTDFIFIEKKDDDNTINQEKIYISENKFTVEEDMVKPKNSNDSFYSSWKRIWESAHLDSVNPSVGIFSEPFGFFQ